MSKLGYALRVARVPLLVGLLLVSQPLFSRYQRALQIVDFDRLAWFWTGLAAIVIGFLAVALAARRGRQPSWLLGVEAVVAALIGVVIPAWGIWIGPDLIGLPGPIQPLSAALSTPIVAPRMQQSGMGVAMNWYVLVLALAWLAVVSESVVVQIRQSRTS